MLANRLNVVDAVLEIRLRTSELDGLSSRYSGTLPRGKPSVEDHCPLPLMDAGAVPIREE
jgi:hypothetical protein